MTSKAKPWSAAELEYLTHNYAVYDRFELARRLPGKTPKDIYNKLYSMGLKPVLKVRPRKDGSTYVIAPWTDKEIKRLREAVEGKSPEERPSSLALLELLPERSRSSINNKLKELGLAVDMKQGWQAWTEEDIHQLIHLSAKHTPRDIAKIMKRSWVAVKSKMKTLNLKAFDGTYSLVGLAKETGYDHRQLIRAKRKLRQKWTKVKHGKRGRYIIDWEQREELLEYLKKDSVVREPPPISSYFWKFVVQNEATGCWHWNGPNAGCYDPQQGKSRAPYRVAHELLNEGVSGPRLFNQCGTKNCANPKHYARRKYPDRKSSVKLKDAA